MFDYIRKPLLWEAWEKNYHKEIGATGVFHLKSVQDIAVYTHLRGSKDLKIAEIGGSDSRLLRALAKHNKCFNVEKFEGADGGATKEIHVPGVKNIKVFLGENDPQLESDSFDVAFSISVVEHVPDLNSFFDDGMRILKKGGLWLHAVDVYVEDKPGAYFVSRYEALRKWATDARVTPIGPVFEGPLAYTCDIASNPDDTMYRWGQISPKLIPLRQRAQCVSLLIGARKA